MPKNKIIIIGGGSFQGKSLIALELAYKLKIPNIISTDNIRNILHIQDPKSPYFCTSTYLMKPQDLEKQKEEVSKILLKLIEVWQKRGESAIIEGMHLSESFIKTMASKKEVFIFAIDNKISFKKRLEYKSKTRKRVEYLDRNGKVKYGFIKPEEIENSVYFKHKKRIEEIHKEIINIFRKYNLKIMSFSKMNNHFFKDIYDRKIN